MGYNLIPSPPACSEELLQLLEVLLMPAAEQGGWLLQWLWEGVYQPTLQPFLSDAAAALGDAGGGGQLAAAFQSYWASLPWRQVSSAFQPLV